VRVVVTGGAGFIGSNVVQGLVEQGGHDVVVLDDLSTGSRTNLEDIDVVTVVEGSVLDRDALDAVFSGADAIIHLAARPSVPRSIADPMATHHTNATGTLEVLEAVRRAGGPYLVVASSSSVYGGTTILPKREDFALRPMTPYAASKVAAECYALAHAACFDLPVLVFRFFNVYGPKQPAGHPYAAVVPAFVAAALGNGPLPIHGDGNQTRDFTFIGSVVGVLSTAVERRITSSTPINLAFGTRISVLDLVAALEEILGVTLTRESLTARRGDVRDSQADDALMRSLFPEASPVPLREGLAATVAWHRKLGAALLAPR
jgi:UDP-glucose 4-epimerase